MIGSTSPLSIEARGVTPEVLSSGFEAFFRGNHQRLFAALCALTGSRQEAEEIAQEAFLKIWERWDRVAELEEPTAYLYRTAMNVFRRRFRRAKLALRHAVGAGDAGDAYEAVEVRQTVLAGLKMLTQDQRAALVLTALVGFSAEEAGAMLGKKPAAVRMLATRGRAAMREVTAP